MFTNNKNLFTLQIGKRTESGCQGRRNTLQLYCAIETSSVHLCQCSSIEVPPYASVTGTTELYR